MDHRSTNIIGSDGLKKEKHDFTRISKLEIVQQKNQIILFMDHRSTNMIESRGLKKEKHDSSWKSSNKKTPNYCFYVLAVRKATQHWFLV